MTDQSEPGAGTDPFADLISLVAGPIAAVVRSFDQLRRGGEELVRGIENFNTTMESLTDTAQRVNRLLDELEEPIRTIVPQVTRTVQATDEIASRLADPLEQVVPGLVRLADFLDSATFAALPKDLGAFLEAINDLMKRLGPLAQLAESTGGLGALFGGLRLPALARPVAAPPPAPPAEEAALQPTAEHPAGKQPVTTKRAAKKKAATKKGAKKKAAAKKAPK